MHKDSLHELFDLIMAGSSGVTRDEIRTLLEPFYPGNYIPEMGISNIPESELDRFMPIFGSKITWEQFELSWGNPWSVFNGRILISSSGILTFY